jgi:hypothetical protein
LRTGEHNLKITPDPTVFFIDLINNKNVDRIVSEIKIGDVGSLELNTAYDDTGGHDLTNVRYDQSADILFVDCKDKFPRQIERRGDGRSWSIVKSDFEDGPYQTARRAEATLTPSAAFGNITISSDVPFFQSGHVDSLIKITHEGQSSIYYLGDSGAVTPAVKVTGIADTGASGGGPGVDDPLSERRISFVVADAGTGSWGGNIEIERSIDGEDFGFKRVIEDFTMSGSSTITANGTTVIVDEDDNVDVWYRARLVSTTKAGTPKITIQYNQGLLNGKARITGYTNNTTVEAEVLSNFYDSGNGPPGSSDWQEGSWSGVHSYPTSIAFHEGRLVHSGGARFWGSRSDDYTNFDVTLEGESAPIDKTLGSGPVDNVYWLISLLRLVAGTAGGEIAIKSSSLDEVMTSTNANAKSFSTEGSSNVQAVKMDTRGVFVQRSGTKAYVIGFGSGYETAQDYEARELTLLVPRILDVGVKRIAIQRQPDTRIHFILNDGTVAILTYEPDEEVLAWTKWQSDTGTSPTVEEAVILPGEKEDRVFYLVNRVMTDTGTTPNTKRFVEEWAKESEALGNWSANDTGTKTWLTDCSAKWFDAAKPTSVPGFSHLQGHNIVVVANDTGQTDKYMKDLSIDTGTSFDQVEFYVNTLSDTGDTGKIGMGTVGYKHTIGGLPYRGDFKSAKLAFVAELGTPLTMMKRVDRLGFLLSDTHNRALLFGSDTGDLDYMPLFYGEGDSGFVDRDFIWSTYDKFSIAFPGLWDEDSRIYVQAKSPRPATVMGLVPHITTNEKR